MDVDLVYRINAEFQNHTEDMKQEDNKEEETKDIQLSEASKPSNNFLKGVKWSPDGACLLSNSDDNVLRLFEPALSGSAPRSVLRFLPGDTVFDYEWYPLMNSSNPATCCLVSTSRGHPIQLWDAFTGDLRASYCAYDHLDEPISALSVTCDPTGEHILAGYDEEIRIFDLGQPGRSCSSFKTLQSTRKGKRKQVEGQRGLISSLAVCPDEPDLFAAGSYSGDILLYSQNDCEAVATLDGRFGGVTHLKFSPNGQYLFSGSRKQGEILCWDVRNTCQVLGKFSRDSSTCQRIYFDIDPLGGRFLATGSRDGSVRIFDLLSAPDENSSYSPCFSFQAHQCATNGVGFHPFFSVDNPLFATASGERQFVIDCKDSSDDEEESPSTTCDNSIGFWRLSLPIEEQEQLNEPAELEQTYVESYVENFEVQSTELPETLLQDG